MTNTLPSWALTPVTPNDLTRARTTQQNGQLVVQWPSPDRKSLRAWVKQHHWPNPFFGFDEQFIKSMLESETNLRLALDHSGVVLLIPRTEHIIDDQALAELDALYESPSNWNALVMDLRDIRRAIEAGVQIHVEGDKTLCTWNQFYTWAHGRYHMLEDGADPWIGHDD